MNEKHFVDTNILIYAFDSSAGAKQTAAADLMEELWGSRAGCLSIQILQEFHVTATRKLGLSVAESLRQLSRFSHWEVHCPGPADVLEAVRLQHLLQVSFWDAMILRSASQAGCHILWSEDLNPGQVYGDVDVRNPFAGAARRETRRHAKRRAP